MSSGTIYKAMTWSMNAYTRNQ